MRKIMLSLLLVSASLFAVAQNPFDNPDNRAYFGARLGLDLTSPGNLSASQGIAKMSMDAFNTGAGFHTGMVFNMPIYMNLYIEPGVSLYYHTFKLDKELIEEALEDSYTGASIREFGISIPIVAGYHFDFQPVKLHVFTGPVFNVGLKGNIHVWDKSGAIDMSGSEGIYNEGGINRANISWRFGAGVDYKDFNFSIYGDPELTNAYHNYDGSKLTFHRNAVCFTIGYNF